MTLVHYVGSSDSRTIFASNFVANGVNDQGTTVWNEANIWQVNVSTAAGNYLLTLSDFSMTGISRPGTGSGPPGPPPADPGLHPTLASHDALGLATQAELDAAVAGFVSGAHPNLASHDALGLATQAELNAVAATITTGNGVPTNVLIKTAAFIAAAGDFIQADATTAGFTVTLPTNPLVGALVSVKKIDATSNTVTIAPSGVGTIDGDANATTTTRWAGAIFEHIGSDAWRIVASMTTYGAGTGVTSVDGQTGAVALNATYVPLAQRNANSGYPGLAAAQGTRDGTKFLRDDGTWQQASTSEAGVLYPVVDTTGVTEATTIINAAQATLTGGGIVNLPRGTILTKINPTKANVTYRGKGMWNTILKPPDLNYMIEPTPTPGYLASNISFEDMAFDFTGMTLGNLASLNGIQTGQVRFTRCRFYNVPGYFIITNGLSGLIVEDCLFHTAGTAIGKGVVFGGGSRGMAYRRNVVRWCAWGVSGHTASDEIVVEDNYFDQGWWLGVSLASNSGGTVSYSASTITDTAANFAASIIGTPDDYYVRALPVLRTNSGAAVTIDYSSNKFTDSAASFLTYGIRKGDIVKFGAIFAVVEEVVSATVIRVEQWLSDADRSPSFQPEAGASYTVHKVVLGKVASFTTTTVTVGIWQDLNGVALTPAAGTRYEVFKHGAYNIHFDLCDSTTIRNNVVKRTWGDSISVFGLLAGGMGTSIIGNTVEEGQDFGITCHGFGNVVANNVVRRQGVTGILVGYGGQMIVVGNAVSGSTWTNTTDTDAICDISVESNDNLIVNNIVDGEGLTFGRRGICVYTGGTQTLSGNRIIGNIGRGHSLSDFRVSADPGGSVVNTVLASNTGTVSVNGAGVAAGTVSNIAIGFGALTAATTGSSNVAVGANALSATTTGTRNVGVGNSALEQNTTGSENVALGPSALLSNTAGVSNVALGAGVLTFNATGSRNVAAGTNAMLGTTTGTDNTAIGDNAGRSITTGAVNTAVGTGALYNPALNASNATTTAVRQTAVGGLAGQGSAAQSNDIVAVGYQALCTGAYAVAIGSGASAGAAGAVALGTDSAGTAATTIVANEIKLGTALHTLNVIGNAQVGGATKALGFYGTTPIVKQTLVPVTAAGVHAALVNLGLIAA